VKLHCTCLVVAVLAVSACEKPNDIPALQEQATIIAKYYQPKVEELAKRFREVVRRFKTGMGGLAPANVDDAQRRLNDANQRLTEAHRKVAPESDQFIGKQAAQLAKAGNVPDLEKLVEETDEKLATDTLVINNELTTVESWITISEAAAASIPRPREVPETSPTPEATSPDPAVP
jgi:hypothetical protein